MKKTRNPRVKELQAQPENRIFFDNATFHQDESYKIGELQGREVLEVKTGHGIARYFVEGNIIGDFIRLEDITK